MERAAATVVTVSKRSSSRGHIEARANGTFRAVVSAGIDPLPASAVSSGRLRPRRSLLRKPSPTCSTRSTSRHTRGVT